MKTKLILVLFAVSSSLFARGSFAGQGIFVCNDYDVVVTDGADNVRLTRHHDPIHEQREAGSYNLFFESTIPFGKFVKIASRTDYSTNYSAEDEIIGLVNSMLSAGVLSSRAPVRHESIDSYVVKFEKGLRSTMGQIAGTRLLSQTQQAPIYCRNIRYQNLRNAERSSVVRYQGKYFDLTYAKDLDWEDPERRNEFEPNFTDIRLTPAVGDPILIQGTDPFAGIEFLEKEDFSKLPDANLSKVKSMACTHGWRKKYFKWTGKVFEETSFEANRDTGSFRNSGVLTKWIIDPDQDDDSGLVNVSHSWIKTDGTIEPWENDRERDHDIKAKRLSEKTIVLNPTALCEVLKR